MLYKHGYGTLAEPARVRKEVPDSHVAIVIYPFGTYLLYCMST